MNQTIECSCGAAKSIQVQFCDPCWEKLPPKNQTEIIGCGEQLTAAKAKLSDAIESSEFILRLMRRGSL